jgi:hypothetical protein
VCDQREVQVVPDVRRYARGKQLVGLVSVRARWDPAEAGGDAVDVGVDGEGGPAHREDEHARGRLRADAGQGPQVRLGRGVAEIVQAAKIDAALALLDCAQDLLDTAGLLVGDPAAADGVGHVLGRGVENLLPGREPLLEPGERPLGVDV